MKFVVSISSGVKWGNQQRNIRTGLRFLCFILILLNTACSTMNISDRNPGGNSWVRLGSSKATMKAFTDPQTWMPAAAAVVIGATGADEKISEWATEHHPIYGSEEAAQKASNSLRTFLASSAVATSLISPANHDSWMPGRQGSLATTAMSMYTTSQITGALKESAARTRPNQIDNESFPSSHSSAASAYATLSAQRVNGLPISLGQRRTLQTGFHVLAGATAWARVEAQAHYPVDVLAGYALGNFIAVLMQESLQGKDHPVWVSVDRDWDSEVSLLRFGFAF